MMKCEKVGNFLRKNVPLIKPNIEELLEMRIGDVDIQPMPDEIEEKIKFGKESGLIRSIFAEYRIRLCLYVIELKPESVACVKDSTIYYSRSPGLRDISESRLYSTAAHELGHVAHHALVGTSEFFCFKELRENFADYVAYRTLREMNITPDGGCRSGMKKFTAVLAKYGLFPSIQNAVSYIKQHSRTELRLSGEDYKLVE